jgi:hypothetical protein
MDWVRQVKRSSDRVDKVIEGGEERERERVVNLPSNGDRGADKRVER